jgi:hypothetical protein
MLNRPEYKRLTRLVKASLEDQKKSGNGLIAITQGFYSMGFSSRRDFAQSWPKLMKELGLVDDGTGTHTYTLAGHGFRDVYSDADEIIAEIKKGRR